MDIRDILARLSDVHGPNGAGEYQCRCPAHDDRKASLSVKQGERGVVLHCKAGCDTARVCEALGIKLRDLFNEPLPERRPARNAGRGRTGASGGKPGAQGGTAAAQTATPEADPPSPSPAAPTQPTVREYPSIAAAFGRLGAIDRVYDYTDAAGQLLYYVVRIRQTDGKTFRQCRPAKAGQREPIVMGVLDEHKHVLYRLPEVRAAIYEHRPVIVVEGEKDADNLAALGYTATTASMGAGKWTEEHSAQLAGADVYLMGDNDDPGREHVRSVAEMLLGVAASVRICDLTSECPALPPKGDISDVLARCVESDREALVNALLRTAQICELTPKVRYQRACQLYGKCVPGYGARDGCIVQYTQDNPDGKALTTFVAVPTRIITRDDGVNQEKVFGIEGWARGGEPLPPIEVPAKSFTSMAWLTEKWDFAANIAPGNTARDRVRYIIAEVGARTARRETIYTHTGWRKIDGKLAYLYQGGAIGARGVNVELDAALRAYTLDAPEDTRPLSEAVLDQYLIRQALPEHVCIPLIAAVYLAPLREFFCAAGCPPGFALYLLGRSGTRKSTAAALALSFFGEFDAKGMPASFADSANAIRKKAFLLKDMLFVVDDYHPETSISERRRMESIAQALSRAFGDGADRGRMRADLGLQESMPSRCVVVITGEDTPNITESGVARYYMVNVTKGDVKSDDILTEVQRMARAGTLRKIMRGYIEYIAARADELPAQLEQRFVKLRARAARENIGAHGRAPEAVAHLMIAYEQMLGYLVSVGAIDEEQVQVECDGAWRVLMAGSRQQTQVAAEEKPTSQYLRALGELLQARVVKVSDLTDPESGVPRDMIGYCDEQYYYFIGGVAYRYVCRLYADQGHEFPLGERMLYKMLREEGQLVPGTDGRNVRLKRIGATVGRYVTIPRKIIDGDKGPEQLSFVNVTGHDPDNPYENGGTHET